MFLHAPRTVRTLGAAAALFFCGGSLAQVIDYTSQASFLSAIAGFQNPQTVNFDNLAAGTLFPSGTGTGGLTFTYSMYGSPIIQVDTGYTTTSGNNYLGLNNPDGAFSSNNFPGPPDSFTINFNHVVNAAGLYVVTGPSVVSAGDFTLSFSNGSVVNVAAPDVTLSDGSTAFYLGLVSKGSSPGFSSVTLTSGGSKQNPNPAFYTFNVDDISSAAAVPEPSTVAMMLAGLVMLSVFPLLRRH